MKSEGVEVPPPIVHHVYIAHIGDVIEEALEIAEDLRRKGLTVDFDVMERSLRAQLKHADRIGALLSVIIGENELERDVVVVRDMETGEQTEVDINFAADLILDKVREKGMI